MRRSGGSARGRRGADRPKVGKESMNGRSLLIILISLSLLFSFRRHVFAPNTRETRGKLSYAQDGNKVENSYRRIGLQSGHWNHDAQP